MSGARKQAITLAETLITLAIIGVLAVLSLSITKFSNQDEKILIGKKQQAETVLVTVSKALASGDTTGLALAALTQGDDSLRDGFAPKLNTKNAQAFVSDFSEYDIPQDFIKPTSLPAVELVDGTTIAFQKLNTSCAKVADGGAPCALAYVDVNEKATDNEKPQFLMAIYRDRAISEYDLCEGYKNGEKEVEINCPSDKPNGKLARIDTCYLGQITQGIETGICCALSQIPTENNCVCANKDMIPSGTECVCPPEKPNFNTQTSKCMEPCVGNKVWDVSQNACVCPSTLPNITVSGQCMPECTNGKIWKNDKCVCPDDLPNLTVSGQCMPACTDGKIWKNDKCACPDNLPELVGGKCTCSNIVERCCIGKVTYAGVCLSGKKTKGAEISKTCVSDPETIDRLGYKKRYSEKYDAYSPTCVSCIDPIMGIDQYGYCHCPNELPNLVNGKCVCSNFTEDCEYPRTGKITYAGVCPTKGKRTKGAEIKNDCKCLTEKELNTRKYISEKERYDTDALSCKTCNGDSHLTWSDTAVSQDFVYGSRKYVKYMYSTLDNKNADGYGYVLVSKTDSARNDKDKSIAQKYADAEATCNSLGARIPTQEEFDVIHTLRIADTPLENPKGRYWTSTVAKVSGKTTYYNVYDGKLSISYQHARYVLLKNTDSAYVLCVAKDSTIPKGDCTCGGNFPNYNTETKQCMSPCPPYREWVGNQCVCKSSSKLKSQGYLKSSEIYDNTQDTCKSTQLECPAWDKLYIVRYKALSAKNVTISQQLRGLVASGKGSTAGDNRDEARATTPGMKAVANALSAEDQARNFMYHFAYIIAVKYKPLDLLSYGVKATGAKAYVVCLNMANSTKELSYADAEKFCKDNGSTVLTEKEFRQNYDDIKKLGSVDGNYWTSTQEEYYYTVKFLIKKQSEKVYFMCNNATVGASAVIFSDAISTCKNKGNVPTYSQILNLYSQHAAELKVNSNYWTNTSSDVSKNYVLSTAPSKLYSEKAYVVCQNNVQSTKTMTYKEAFDFCKVNGSTIPSLLTMPAPSALKQNTVYWSSTIDNRSVGKNKKYFDLIPNIDSASVVGELSPRSWFNMFNDTDAAAVTEDETEEKTEKVGPLLKYYQDIDSDIDSRYVSAYQVKGNCRELCDKGGDKEKNECVNTCENFKVTQGIFNDCVQRGDNGQNTEFCTGGELAYKGCPCSVAETFRRYASPLVLDLFGDGLVFTSLEDGVIFDLDADGKAEKTAWTTLQTKFDNAFLCLDKNGNGQIDNGKELFGDQNGEATGFDELAKYDENGDGVINKKDKAYYQLRLWADMNKDAKVDAGEWKTLEEAGVIEIPVNYSIENDSSGQIKKDINGNIVGFVGSFKMLVKQIVNGVASMVETIRQMIDVFFLTS